MATKSAPIEPPPPSALQPAVDLGPITHRALTTRQVVTEYSCVCNFSKGVSSAVYTGLMDDSGWQLWCCNDDKDITGCPLFQTLVGHGDITGYLQESATRRNRFTCSDRFVFTAITSRAVLLRWLQQHDQDALAHYHQFHDWKTAHESAVLAMEDWAHESDDDCSDNEDTQCFLESARQEEVTAFRLQAKQHDPWIRQVTTATGKKRVLVLIKQ